MAAVAQPRQAVAARAGTGAVAGLVGGVVFGAMMAAMGALPMVAMLVGSENAGVGAVVHLVISALFGVGFGLLAGSLLGRPGPLLAAGVGYGLLWWVLGALLIMPLWLGGSVFTVNTPALMSMVGHVLYGVVTSLTLYGLHRRSAVR